MSVKCEEYHVPVLLMEAVDGLDIKPGGIYADLTFGGGGHSREILRRLNGTGHLYGFDQDMDALQQASELEGEGNFTFIRSNFRFLKNWMLYYGHEQIDGILADLGVSSHHFDDEGRGFSFRFDVPLDMRMNQRGGITAADVVNTYDEKRIADILFIYGELKNSRRMETPSAIIPAATERFMEAIRRRPADSRPEAVPDGWKRDHSPLAALYGCSNKDSLFPGIGPSVWLSRNAPCRISTIFPSGSRLSPVPEASGFSHNPTPSSVQGICFSRR